MDCNIGKIDRIIRLVIGVALLLLAFQLQKHTLGYCWACSACNRRYQILSTLQTAWHQHRLSKRLDTQAVSSNPHIKAYFPIILYA